MELNRSVVPQIPIFAWGWQLMATLPGSSTAQTNLRQNDGLMNPK